MIKIDLMHNISAKFILSLSSFYFSDSITITFTENDELSNFFDQQVQQVFYNIQHAFNRRLGTMFKYCRFACADC